MNSRSYGRFSHDMAPRKNRRLTASRIPALCYRTICGKRLAKKGKLAAVVFGSLMYMIAETHAMEESKDLLQVRHGAALMRGDKKMCRRTFGLISKLRATIARSVPFGYQDETGFHYGVKQ